METEIVVIGVARARAVLFAVLVFIGGDALSESIQVDLDTLVSVDSGVF